MHKNKNGMLECSVCHSKLLTASPRTVSKAYDRHRSKVSRRHRALHVLLVVGDCILVGLQPILVYMSKVDGKFKFSPISVNFLTEAAKVIFAIAMLLFQARRQKVGEKPLLSFSTFVQAARSNVLLAVPAFLYAINNYLKFIMQLYFNPATVKMLSNLKVLVIALLLRMIMRRHFSIIQWEALALLLIGISVNQLRSLPEGSTSLDLPLATVAYLYTLIFCLLSCLQDPTLGIRARLQAMATTSNTNQYHEGQSTQRPPLFDGTNYNYWKCRMRIYLQSINYEIWQMTEMEYTAPTIPYAQWNDDQKNQTMNNAKAMNALFCALTKEEFNRVSNATTAHQIWHTLEVTHEGTNKVKESKISVLVHRFEMFRMKDNETMSEMITRFTDITNSLVALGKTYTQAEMVRKVLRALTPEWEKKTTAIEEANDLSTLTLENLVGNLMAYEVQLEDRKKDTESHQAKKKSLAFKAMTDSEDEEEIAMFTRKFKKFLKKGKFHSKVKDSNDPPTCFRCNKIGHMKKDCPLENAKNKEKSSNFKKDKYPKNKFAKNKKAYQATWDDSDSSSEEETDENNEVANVCFMAAQEHVPKKECWILDSSCSKHMTGHANLLSTIQSIDGGTVTFGDNNKGKVIDIGMVTVPSLASVYNEYALKSQFDTSIYLQNIFLYGYGAIFNFLAITGIAIFKGPSSFDILQGHSRATMLLILNNAAQGILSSFFFKYADTILKKYSSTVATIFTGIASAALFGHTLTINFLLGISIVFISMHQFFSPLAKVKDETPNGTVELMAAEDIRSNDASFVNMTAGAADDASHLIGHDERKPLLPT